MRVKVWLPVIFPVDPCGATAPQWGYSPVTVDGDEVDAIMIAIGTATNNGYVIKPGIPILTFPERDK